VDDGIAVDVVNTRVFSSRKLEQAEYDSVAFRFVAVNDHPDHDTIATFRRRFFKDIEGLFAQVLSLAREMGCSRRAPVALDGTKMHSNASRHSALWYEHAGKTTAVSPVQPRKPNWKIPEFDRRPGCQIGPQFHGTLYLHVRCTQATPAQAPSYSQFLLRDDPR
jgi:Transposase domain (DUF772)